MAAHSRVLAWRLPWTEEPGGLLPMGSQSQTRLMTEPSAAWGRCCLMSEEFLFGKMKQFES